jgi:hypothetical protein
MKMKKYDVIFCQSKYYHYICSIKIKQPQGAVSQPPSGFKFFKNERTLQLTTQPQ